MSDRANIKVGREFYENHNERRKELGLTWEGYIESQQPDSPDVDFTTVLNRLDDLESQLPRKVAEELR